MKKYVPRSLRRYFGRLRSVANRLRIWRQVNKNLTGVNSFEAKILSAAYGKRFRTVWSDLDKWQFPMVENDCKVNSLGVGKFNVRAYTDDLFHVMPMQEPAVESTIRAHLRPGDAFIDAGANIGFYTILASQLVGAEGRVISFEMIPETAQILRTHIEQNKCSNARVVEGALASVAGLKIRANITAGKSGRASIARSGGTDTIEVRSISLSEELKDIPEVRLVKMDIEGAELDALKGLGSEISKIEAIIFESRGTIDVVNYLKSHGFYVLKLDGNNAFAQRSQPN